MLRAAWRCKLSLVATLASAESREACAYGYMDVGPEASPWRRKQLLSCLHVVALLSYMALGVLMCTLQPMPPVCEYVDAGQD